MFFSVFLCLIPSFCLNRYLEANGTEPLLLVMETHLQTSSKIQRLACWAILTLAGSDEIARLIIGQGGESHIMRAMTTWKSDSLFLPLFSLELILLCRDDAGVQQFACWAITNLALADEEIKQKLKYSGVLEVWLVFLFLSVFLCLILCLSLSFSLSFSLSSMNYRCVISLLKHMNLILK